MSNASIDAAFVFMGEWHLHKAEINEICFKRALDINVSDTYSEKIKLSWCMLKCSLRKVATL